MIIKNKMLFFFISICLSIVAGGCFKGDALPSETDAPEADPMYIESNEDLPTESDPDNGLQPKQYENFAEAYLAVLLESDMNQNDPITAIDDRKIAVVDVFGDETPELLYIYNDDIRDYLRIFSYAKQGAELVFDSRVYTAAGGGDNYCIYLTYEGELMVYHSTFSFQYSCGLWPIIPNQSLAIVEDYGVYNYSGSLAQLYYVYVEGETILMQYSEEISEEEYYKAINEIMGKIDRIIFISSLYKEYGPHERNDLWKDINPFEADCMTYDEAISWLEAQIEMGQSE